MAQRAAIVTGGSSGIGLEIARMLLEEGYAVTVASRRPDKLEQAVADLSGEGREIASVAGSMADEAVIAEVVATHRERFGRLDVLVNNAGLGIGAPVAEIEAKRLDMQLDVNLRAIVLFYRESVEMLRAAAAEHRSARRRPRKGPGPATRLAPRVVAPAGSAERPIARTAPATARDCAIRRIVRSCFSRPHPASAQREHRPNESHHV